MKLWFTRTFAVAGLCNCGGTQVDLPDRLCTVSVLLNEPREGSLADGMVVPSEWLYGAIRAEDTCERFALRTAAQVLLRTLKFKPTVRYVEVEVSVTNGNGSSAVTRVRGGELGEVEGHLASMGDPPLEVEGIEDLDALRVRAQGLPC